MRAFQRSLTTDEPITQFQRLSAGLILALEEGNRGCKDNSSETDSISHEFNEAMDIDALKSNGCKKHAHRLLSTRIPPLPTHENSPVAHVVKKVPIKVGDDFFSSLLLLLSKFNTLGLRYMKAHNNELTDTKAELSRVDRTLRKQDEALKAFKEQKSYNILGSLRKFKEKLLLYSKVACGPFNVWKVDFNLLTDADMSRLDFDIFNPSKPAWDSFVATWKGELYLGEGDGFATADMAPSIKGYSSLRTNLVFTTGSFALTNYFKGYGSSPANLVFIARNFALANYFRGCGSSSMNIVFIVESFTLDNYFSGYGFLPANLVFTAGSFALANYFKGCGSSPTNLVFTVWSFTLANYFRGYGSLPANLVFTTRTYALANCFRGFDSSPANLIFTDDSFVGMEFYS
ncbi:hypothetical protein J1N35_037377 [Gossypium stocksii]|uniref:Uncharacterized protein n=1 Tax=Gossypium stocksii TaxID=47602 RepID=A0A9D3ZLK8_9ROSI|nr:hypothetical protein J1N35_037377 [Gossypium stocksii]